MSLAVIVPILEAIFKYAPGAVTAIRELFKTENPTAEDWDKLRTKLGDMDYHAYVPDSKIPKP